jgi:ferredoxin--NADP+ reductase
MFEVIDREDISPGLIMLRIRAPEIARKAKPGQFVIVRVDETGERVPLSLADWDDESITVIVQEVGTSTRKLGILKACDSILDLAGPLGSPSEIEKYGTVAVVSGCFGTGPGYALAKALKAAGNKVVYIVEARNKGWLFWLDKIKGVSDQLVVTCGDGSAGDYCYANKPLEEILRSQNVDRIYAIGCTFMMRDITNVAAPKIDVRVSLMPLMVDGTGMCGACRCSVKGEMKLGCVHGPEFPGHDVDWELLIERMRGYLEDEAQSLDLWERENWHRALKAKASSLVQC